MVAASGWPASMWAPSSSPVITRSSSTFQFACGFERDVEPFVLEEALLVGDGERRHVGELDEAELQLVLLERQHLGRAAHAAAIIIAAAISLLRMEPSVSSGQSSCSPLPSRRAVRKTKKPPNRAGA